MTLAEAVEIFRYWQRHPPVHLLVASALGLKAKAAPDAGSGLLPGFGVAEGTALGMPAPVFDLEELRAKNRAQAAAIARRNAAASR
jgi:hypothetical protein